jgi:hypothetical protein
MSMHTKFAPYFDDVPAVDIATIRKRAGRRTTTRRLGTAGAALLVSTTAAAAVVRLSSEGSVDVQGPAERSIRTQTPSLVWSTGDSDFAVVRTMDAFTSSNGAVFALSTAPSASSDDASTTATFAYRSSDGVTWEPVDGGETLSIISLTEDAAGGLIAVGLAPDGSVRIGTSADDGLTFASSPIPFDLEAATWNGISPTLVSARMRSSDGVTAAALQFSLFADATSFLPDGLDARDGAITTVDGVEVLGAIEDPASLSEPVCGADGGELRFDGIDFVCVTTDGGGRLVLRSEVPGAVVGTHTWEQLGVPPAVVAAVRNEIQLFRSVDGGAFEHVGSAPNQSGAEFQLAATESGFVLSARAVVDGVADRANVMTSSDGAAWNAVDHGAVDFVQHVGSVGDRLLVGGQDLDNFDDLNIVSTSPDGTKWDDISLLDLVRTVEPETWSAEAIGYSTGPIGAVIVVNAVRIDGSGEPPKWFLVHSSDGVRWSVEPLPTVNLSDERLPRTPLAPIQTADTVIIPLAPNRDQAATVVETSAVDPADVEPVFLVGRYP